MEYIVAAVVSLVIFYFIIKDAVFNGTKMLRKQMELQNRLKVEDLRRQGVSEELIKEMIGKTVGAK